MFDTSRLRGRIIEKFGTLTHFAENVPMALSTLTSRLSGKTYWQLDEVDRICELLEIDSDDIVYYFFTRKLLNS